MLFAKNDNFVILSDYSGFIHLSCHAKDTCFNKHYIVREVGLIIFLPPTINV